MRLKLMDIILVVGVIGGLSLLFVKIIKTTKEGLVTPTAPEVQSSVVRPVRTNPKKPSTSKEGNSGIVVRESGASFEIGLMPSNQTMIPESEARGKAQAPNK